MKRLLLSLLICLLALPAMAEELDEEALLQLAEYLHIQPQSIFAFGDDYSDISMLEAAGMGVAMGNAIEKVKKAAVHITLSNEEDGVADYMERHVLRT